MSLGRLLASGRSLVGLRNGESRYRESKQARLPKFISPKNPFAPSVDGAELPPAATMPSTVSATAYPTMRAPKEKRSSLWLRVGGWVGRWGAKVNPFRPRQRKVGVAQVQAALTVKPQQPELTLEHVRVLRNDLSDADGAKVKSSSVAKPGIPMVAATLEKLEPVGAAWDRLATKLTGSDPT